MESCSDSDSNDDGLEIGRHGHGDEDIVINTEHASKEVDAEINKLLKYIYHTHFIV